MGQATFLGVALAHLIKHVYIESTARTDNYAAKASGELAMSSTVGSFYESYDTVYTEGYNLWQFASKASSMYMTIWSIVATVTSILSMAGIVPEINMMVWTYGMFTGSLAVNAVYVLLMGYTYDTVVYTSINETDSNKKDRALIM